MTRRPILAVTLCADDYGIAPGVGSAIRELAGLGRLSATSCMVGGPHWADEASRLRAQATADTGFAVGLHLVLSDQAPVAPMPRLAPLGRLPSLPRLMALAAARLLDPGEIAAEIERQLDRFEEAWGRPPAFVDGHQHVHQLPIVRDALITLYDRRLRRFSTRVRYCTRSPADILASRVSVPRALIIAGLGRAWQRAGRAAGIPGNDHFAGVRSGAERQPFGTLLRAWLVNARPGTLLMCHPGHVDAALIAVDPLTTPREAEYAFLTSDAFPALLEELAVVLAPPGRLDARQSGESPP